MRTLVISGPIRAHLLRGAATDPDIKGHFGDDRSFVRRSGSELLSYRRRLQNNAASFPPSFPLSKDFKFNMVK